METPVYSTFIISLISKIDLVTQHFIATGFNSLGNYLQVPIATACTLLIILIGFGIMHGFVDMSVKTFSKIAYTIGGVNLFAFSWTWFNTYFIGLFLNVANEVSGFLIQGDTFHIPLLPGTGSGLTGALQTVLIESVKVGGWVMAQGGFTDWLPYFIGLTFMLSGTIVVGLAVVEVIVVKLYLAMLLAAAPFFICCYLFPQTKGIFDGWLNQLKGFAIALILVGIGVGLCMFLMHWVVGGYFLQEAVNVKLYSIVPLTIADTLCVILLIGVIPIAKQIGGANGGSGFSAVGGVVGSMAGSMLGASAKSMSGVRSLASNSMKAGRRIGQEGLAASRMLSLIHI